MRLGALRACHGPGPVGRCRGGVPHRRAAPCRVGGACHGTAQPSNERRACAGRSPDVSSGGTITDRAGSGALRRSRSSRSSVRCAAGRHGRVAAAGWPGRRLGRGGACPGRRLGPTGACHGRHNDRTSVGRPSAIRPTCRQGARSAAERGLGRCGVRARVARSSVVPPDGTAGARGHGPRRSFVRSAAGWHRQATGPGRGRPGGLATAGWAPQARRRRGSAG
jgi:hypothetical protein